MLLICRRSGERGEGGARKEGKGRERKRGQSVRKSR